MADIGHDPAREICDGGKGAAVDQIPLDLGEPELYLIEPGGVGGELGSIGV